MKILGLDPGLASTGWGIIEKNGGSSRPIAYGGIHTSARTPTPARLIRIHRQIEEILSKYQPDVVAIEQLFYSTGDRSAMAVLGVGQAVGVITLAVAQRGIEIREYDARRIKEAVVGYGSATKEQIQYMVQKLLKLKEKPTPDHAADALAVAICHAHTAGVLDQR